MPVLFGVLTSVAAFLPLVLVGGNMAAMFSGVGAVVIGCLAMSIVESQLVLPAHLAHARLGEATRSGRWTRLQDRIGARLDHFIQDVYAPFLERLLAWRYVVAASAVGALIVAVALLVSGRVPYEFMPPIEGDHVAVSITMPSGTPVETTEKAIARVEASAAALRREIEEAFGPERWDQLVRHRIVSIGTRTFSVMGGVGVSDRSSGGHVAEVTLALHPAAERRFSTHVLGDRWRELTGEIPDAESVIFAVDQFSAGRPIEIELRGTDMEKLEAAAASVRLRLSEYSGVHDLWDSFSTAQREIELRLRPEARPLDLTQRDLARQVRQAFYGEEVQRVQRGTDEVRVMVRYPSERRRTLGDLDDLRVRTDEGAEVPLSTVAEVVSTRGLSRIERVDRARVIRVAADVDRAITTPGRINESMARELPTLLADYPGVGYRFAGAQQEDEEASGALAGGFLLALFAIYALLAVPLGSYSQPLIIMSVIPFGALGAVVGHLVMGMPVVFFSVLGIVALSGVVVNASLMLVHFVNAHREEGGSIHESLVTAGQARFRPIVLTSLTTFFGLLPLLLEKAVPLQVMVPMAISLAFGVLLSTVVTLLLVPCEYAIVEDLRRRATGEPAPGALEPSIEG